MNSPVLREVRGAEQMLHFSAFARCAHRSSSTGNEFALAPPVARGATRTWSGRSGTASSTWMGRDLTRSGFCRGSFERIPLLFGGWSHRGCRTSRLKPPSCGAGLAAAEDEETAEDVGMSIWKLSLPSLGIVLADPLMSLIDTGCVGQLSSIQLAALGPNTLIFNFFYGAFSFLGVTTCNFMASTNMKGSTPQEHREMQTKASRTLSQALCLAAILGLAITGFMEALAPQLLLLLGAGPDYIQPALTYLRIRALSAPAVLVLHVGHGACLGRQDAKTPLFVNLFAASINLIGDLVFTLWAAWGVAGAAWATVASQYIAIFILFKALQAKVMDGKYNSLGDSTEKRVGLSSSVTLPLEIGWFGLPTMEVLGPFYNMASSLMLRYLLGMVAYTLMGKVAAQVGMLSIAAHQVAMQVFWFLSFLPEALSISAQSLIARDLKRNGEGCMATLQLVLTVSSYYLQRAHTVARVLLVLSLGLGIALTSVVAVVHFLGTSWLTADEKVASLVISVTKQSMIAEFLCAVSVVIESIAIATGDLAYLSRMQLLNLGVMLVALTSSYKGGWGLSGVWWCLVLFFGTRMAYHIFHISSHWDTHILGAAPSRLHAV